MGVNQREEATSLLDTLLTRQRLVLGARLCHWPSSPIFGNQYWGLLLEKAWPGARGIVLGSVLQKLPHSLGLGFLSYKIRELDRLLSKNIPGLAFSDLLR